MNGEKETVFPCVILRNDGTVSGLTKTNRKGVNKSIENSSLWHLHEQTGRLIPFDQEKKLLKITEKNGWVEAVLEGNDQIPENRDKTTANTAQKPSTSASIGFIGELSDIIRARKETMPEGSYTTHLFSSGNEKIRKKTGEEAIELLLAGKREDIIYEAADLVFHLLVLLEDEKIGLDEVIGELQKRHGG